MGGGGLKKTRVKPNYNSITLCEWVGVGCDVDKCIWLTVKVWK